MNKIIGNEYLFEPASVGILTESALYQPDANTTILSFTAESDSGGAVSPCFVASLPEVIGYMVRGTAVSPSGFATTATSTITLTDQFGASASYAVTTSGAADFRTDSTSLYWVGAMSCSIDTMGAASKRLKITMVFRKEYNRI